MEERGVIGDVEERRHAERAGPARAHRRFARQIVGPEPIDGALHDSCVESAVGPDGLAQHGHGHRRQHRPAVAEGTLARTEEERAAPILCRGRDEAIEVELVRIAAGREFLRELERLERGELVGHRHAEVRVRAGKGSRERPGKVLLHGLEREGLQVPSAAVEAERTGPAQIQDVRRLPEHRWVLEPVGVLQDEGAAI